MVLFGANRPIAVGRAIRVTRRQSAQFVSRYLDGEAEPGAHVFMFRSRIDGNSTFGAAI